MTRDQLRDLADRALHRSQFDLRLGGATRQSRIVFIEYLEGRIATRIASGRSEDCDEFRTLLKFAA